MSITVKTVESRKDLKSFVKFPFKIFKGNKFWVPQLTMDEMEIFNRKKNPSYDSGDSKLFLAYKDGEIVGRVAAINSLVANEKYKTKNLRFGWFDSIDDQEVADSLFNAVERWGRELGLETLTGPHGFNDLDPEGMLIEGFDKLQTIAVYYNHPYYKNLLDDFGFEKEIDYIEFRADLPKEGEIPEKLLRIADKIKERTKLRIIELKSKKELIKVWAVQVFDVLEEAFEEIYGSVPLNKKQVDYYIKKYFSFVEKDLIQIVVNEEDKVVGFIIALPSLSHAFQKAKGSIFPFGWYYLLKGLKERETLDFYLAGIRKSYQGRGLGLLMILEMRKAARRMGFKTVESNPELENNTKIHGQWKYFKHEQHKRRRIFKKQIK